MAQISTTEVAAISSQFDTSFSAIQQGIRGVEQVIRETTKTLERILEDLSSSNWNNLRSQDRKLRGEMANIDSSYAAAKDNINTSNAELEASLVAILEGQVKNHLSIFFRNLDIILVEFF